ncbi:MAG: RodZ domain-containing protein [Pseudomonadota bacterium]
MFGSTHEEPQHSDPDEALLREVGAHLRQTRMERGESIETVAENLRIRPGYLEGLERGDLSVIPGRPYALGFLRSYAQYLGFDGNDVIAQTRSSVGSLSPTTDLQHRVPLSETRLPKVPVLAVSLLALAGIYAGWSWFGKDSRPDDVPIAEITPEIDPDPVPEPAPSTEALSRVRPAIYAPPPLEREPLADTTPDSAREPAATSVVEPPETLTELRRMDALSSAPIRDPSEIALAETAPLPASTPRTESVDVVDQDVAISDEGEVIIAELTPLGDETVRSTTETASPSPPPPVENVTPPAQAVEPPTVADELTRETSRSTEDVELADPSPVVGRTSPSPIVVADLPPPSELMSLESAGVEAEAAIDPRLTEANRRRAAQIVAGLTPIGNSEPAPRIFQAEPAGSRVILRARSGAWVHVSSTSNDYLWVRTLKPGEAFVVPDRQDLVLWTGNAGGIEVIVDGQALSPLGPETKVVRGVSLQPGALKRRLGSATAARPPGL